MMLRGVFLQKLCGHVRRRCSTTTHLSLSPSPDALGPSQVVEDLPRVIRSVDMIHQEVISLKDRITVVKEDVERVSVEPSSVCARVTRQRAPDKPTARLLRNTQPPQLGWHCSPPYVQRWALISHPWPAAVASRMRAS
jgi:hypothetical protein